MPGYAAPAAKAYAILPSADPEFSQLAFSADGKILEKETKATKPADLLAAAIAENVRQTGRHVKTSTPILAAAVDSGQLKVAGGVYDLADGRVKLL